MSNERGGIKRKETLIVTSTHRRGGLCVGDIVDFAAELDRAGIPRSTAVRAVIWTAVNQMEQLQATYDRELPVTTTS